MNCGLMFNAIVHRSVPVKRLVTGRGPLSYYTKCKVGVSNQMLYIIQRHY